MTVSTLNGKVAYANFYSGYTEKYHDSKRKKMDYLQLLFIEL